MNSCHSYIWRAGQGFICNESNTQYWVTVFLLALFLILAVLSFIAIIRLLRRILELIERLQPPVKLFRISQLQGGIEMAITGVVLGGQGSFQETPLPPGSQLPSGITPVWSTTDTSVTLTPSSDGTTCGAAVAATDTNTSFPLTVTASAALPDGTTPISTVTVPILPPPVTGFQIDQTA